MTLAPCLKTFVIHSSYLHPNAKRHTLKNESNTITIGISWTSMLRLIDSCRNKVSANQYHVTLLRALVKSLSRSLGFKSWQLTRYWFTTLGEKDGVRVEARFRRKLILSGLLTYLPTYSWHNQFLESPWFIACVISTILSTLFGYNLRLTFYRKNGETTRWKNNMLSVFFGFLIQEKQTSFSFMVNYPHQGDRRAAFSVDPKSWSLRLGRLNYSCQGVLPRAYYFPSLWVKLLVIE